MCGATIRFGALKRGSSGAGGSGAVDVERGAGDLAGDQRALERLGVDDRASGGVDQDRVRSHPGQGTRVDQVVGRRCERAVQRDEIGALEQRVQRHFRGDRGSAGIGAPPARVQDGHVEPGRPSCHRSPDPPHPDDPERGALDSLAQVATRLPRKPVSLRHRRERLGQLARRRQQQRERQVGGRLGQHVRRVPDRDTSRGGGVDVDVVVAHRVVRDRAQMRAVLDQRGVHPVGQQRQQPLDAGRTGGQLLVGRGQPLRPDLDLMPDLQPVEGRARQLSSHEAARHRARILSRSGSSGPLGRGRPPARSRCLSNDSSMFDSRRTTIGWNGNPRHTRTGRCRHRAAGRAAREAGPRSTFPSGSTRSSWPPSYTP